MGETCLRGSRPGMAVDGIGSAMGNVVKVAAASGSYDVEEDWLDTAVGGRDRALGTGLKTVAPFSGDRR